MDDRPTLLADVVETSAAVAGTTARNAKRDALASLLARVRPDEVPVTVALLTGVPLQGRFGVGWRTLRAAEAAPAPHPVLTVDELDRALSVLAGLSGPGSTNERRRLVGDVLSRATTDEQRFLWALLSGELRQGALAGVMLEAIARAAQVPAPAVRRATMLGGDLSTVAAIALRRGADGLAEVRLEVGRPLQPMLASTAGSASEAVEEVGDAIVDWKLDGIRIQVHRRADEVRIWTRNLNEITDRLPEVVARVRAMPATALVLDGEALVVDGERRPVMFQDTASRVGTDGVEGGAVAAVTPWFFDLLHHDGVDLVDEPLVVRRTRLVGVAEDSVVPHSRTGDPEEAGAMLAQALDAGHEGVVIKGASAPYAAGRRGKAWRKVKPVHTLDLVVLAAEWGHGRRTRWLSNLHLGARADDDAAADTGFVMVGKTFKGLSDEILTWQTEALGALATGEPHPEGDHVVAVRPELVVEVAVDGVQRSTRYAGGVALRFARVVRYRPDKASGDADTIASVRALGSHP